MEVGHLAIKHFQLSEVSQWLSFSWVMCIQAVTRVEHILKDSWCDNSFNFEKTFIIAEK